MADDQNTLGLSTALWTKVINANGDYAKLTEAERGEYYQAVCESLGLNPLTRPLEYLSLNGKLRLYALRDCTDQLRRIHGISIHIVNRERVGDIYIVTARATDKTGREDESTGAVSLGQSKGDAMANQLMRAETKCLPLKAEILTREGCKTYNHVTIGEEVLAYDIARDRCVWTPLLGVSISKEEDTVRFGSARHSVRCTPAHTWVIHPRPSDGNQQRRLVQTKALKAVERIVLAAPCVSGDHPLDPVHAALLGWVMCDGSIRRRKGWVQLDITQSKPDTVQEISDLIQQGGYTPRVDHTPSVMRAFPHGKRYRVQAGHRWVFNAAESRQILSKAGIHEPQQLPGLVTQLSQPARAAMLRAMMLADGSTKGLPDSRRGGFGKKMKPGVMEAWRILTFLEGQLVGRLRDVGGIPYQSLCNRRYWSGNRLTCTDPQREPVWCPETAYGTWVAKYDERLIITGNSKRRVTLSIAGLGALDEVELEAIPPERLKAQLSPEPHRSHAVLDETSDREASALLLEQILDALKQLVPGGTPQDKARLPMLIRETFGVHGWSAVKELKIPALQAGYAQLREAIEAQAPDEPADEDVPIHEPPDEPEPDAATDTMHPPDRATGAALATPDQIARLRELAQEVGDEAYADLQDVLEHNPKGVQVETAEAIRQRLEARLAKASAAAPDAGGAR
jgi:hypothetical protein